MAKASVDVKSVMEQIKREVYGDGERPVSSIPSSLYEGVRQLSLLQHLDGRPPISSYHPGRGWLIAPIKRMLGKLTKWYVKPLAEKITERNRVEADVIHGLLRQIETLEREIHTLSVGQSITPARTDEVERFPDWYFGLENRLRGLSEEVAELQKVYLPLFQGKSRVLDLGCGRGEFLELLHRSGIDAEGVDLDPDMVAVCREKGLKVEQAEMLEHLEKAANSSLGGVFCAQVVEHFPPQKILDLITLAFHRLEPGGVLVVESLNPACLTIFSGAYYADPTHRAPIHPEVIRFFMERTGFTEVDAWYGAAVPQEDRLEMLEESSATERVMNANLAKLNSVLYGYAHYAAIGRRP